MTSAIRAKGAIIRKIIRTDRLGTSSRPKSRVDFREQEQPKSRFRCTWPYQPSRDAWLEKVEVRAWGIFVQELLACVESPQDGWSALAEAAQATSLEARPAFAELVRQLG